MCLHAIYSNEALIALETWATLAPYNTSLLTSKLLRAYAKAHDSRRHKEIADTEDEDTRTNKGDVLLQTVVRN